MFLKIKNIPKVNWSSKKPYNFRPKFSTFFFLFCLSKMIKSNIIDILMAYLNSISKIIMIISLYEELP